MAPSPNVQFQETIPVPEEEKLKMVLASQLDVVAAAIAADGFEKTVI